MMKTILITGGSSGIGEATAEYLDKSGYRTILIGRNEERLKALVTRLTNSDYITYDLCDIYGIDEIYNQLQEKDIVLDGLVHCAGISPLMKVEDNDAQVMEEAFKINCLSFIELMKFFQCEGAYNKGASVVAVSSVAASCASYRQTVYGATKAALEQAVRCMSKECIEKQIRVNCISPGAVNTEMFKKLCSQSETLLNNTEKRYPLGIIPPESIAENIEYLLSDKSKYTTGAVLTVDAGYFAWK